MARRASTGCWIAARRISDVVAAIGVLIRCLFLTAAGPPARYYSADLSGGAVRKNMFAMHLALAIPI